MATVNGTHPKSSAGAAPSALPAGNAGVKKNVSAAGPAPSTAPPAPPTTTRVPPRTSATGTSSVTVNGTTTSSKTKKKEAAPPDTATLFENVKNRIAVLEEDKRHLEEDERRAAEEARENIKGIHDSVIQSKYIELFQEMKRIEREFGKEKQKLVKEKDASKAQLTKANIAKTKLENLARELQKDNKKLRDDTKRLAANVEDAQEEILAMKEEMERRLEQVKKKEKKTREAPDIVVKVVCKYRAELLFKISRKAKLSRLFNTWTERMESLSSSKNNDSVKTRSANGTGAKSGNGSEVTTPQTNFVFLHLGRTISPDQTPEELDMEGGDEILAVEMMDLTDDSAEPYVPPVQRETIEKNWTEDPAEAAAAMEDVFNGVVRERLKHVLRQYEVREKHFECVVRSKELEMLVTRARLEELRRLTEEEIRQLRQKLEEMQDSQNKLMDKVIACCQELLDADSGGTSQQLIMFLQEEMEKRGLKLPPDTGLDSPVNGHSGE
ncbi:hypothetical protein FS837_007036 [Tulasnella sp. UAMH 9824]|nr:hypothetical protein FS837_007036 [Tulasnella sp. UAMH 9824]